MQVPALDDTIIAVSTGWTAAPLAIVRLSGPIAFDLLSQIGITLLPPPARPRTGWREATLTLDSHLIFPATVFWFRTPTSYTGQDVAEIHTVGSLPALRAVCDRLIERGARRAMPGEFTARAFLNGRLDADQVESVLALINAQDHASARHAARLDRKSAATSLHALTDRLTELIALIEAGIDFAEEEGVEFISPAHTRRSIGELIRAVAAVASPDHVVSLAAKPHVALAGLPNAGKSTLFNALLGYDRAIVSPVLGTTRDVLSAEIQAGGVTLLIQDCAGLGASVDDLESAAHLAAEQAADRADLVLWVHDCAVDWDTRETDACRRIPEDRRLLVLSKLDRRSRARCQPPTIPFAATVAISALSGSGLPHLRQSVAQCLETLQSGPPAHPATGQLGSVVAALERAQQAATDLGDTLVMPEVVAFELRQAYEALEMIDRGPLAEEVLAEIFGRFCIGK